MVPLDDHEFARWRAEANRALAAARAQESPGLRTTGAPLAEQAAQLAVKALLHGMGKGPWGHDLPRLAEAVREEASAVWTADLDDAARRLSRHYIPARYPDAHPSGPAGDHYGREDLTQALVDAGRIMEAADRAWAQLQAEAGSG